MDQCGTMASSQLSECRTGPDATAGRGHLGAVDPAQGDRAVRRPIGEVGECVN